MSEPTEAQRKEAERAGIYENPGTPGYHAALVGGGLGGIGSLASVCVTCGALIGFTENTRSVHTAWHEGQMKALTMLAEAIEKRGDG